MTLCWSEFSCYENYCIVILNVHCSVVDFVIVFAACFPAFYIIV